MNAATRKQIEQLVRANAELDAAAKAAENSVLAGFRKAEAYALRRTAELLATAPNFAKTDLQARLAWYLQNIPSQELAGSSRYFSAVQSYVDKYDEIGKLAEKVLGAGGVKADFTTIPKEFIEAMKKRDLIQFADLNQAAHLRLDQQLLDSVVVGRTPAGALQSIRSTITGSYKWGKGRGLYEWHAGTYARTAQMRTARQMLVAKADELQLKEFLYVGPVDSKKRPFCLQIVGTVLNRQEIEDLDNGQTGDTFSDGGGYNCRDTWSPVDKAFAKKLKEEPQETKGAVKNAAAKAAPKPKPAPPAKPAPDPLEKPPVNPKDWAPAKSVEEATTWAKERDLANNIDFGKLHLEAANEMNRRIAAHLERFPHLRKRLDFMGSMQGRKKYLRRVYGENMKRRADHLYPEQSEEWRIAQAKKWTNQALKKVKSDGVAVQTQDWTYNDITTGQNHAIGRGVQINEKYMAKARTVTVEEIVADPNGPFGIGRTADGTLIKGSLKKVEKKIEPIEEWRKNNISAIKNKWHPEGTESVAATVDHELGHLIDFGNLPPGGSFRAGNISRSDVFHKIYKAQGNIKTMEDELSRYAAHKYPWSNDPIEMIAEAWSEFLNNPNARGLCKEIGEVLLRILAEAT